jgi:hypothetical protein
MRSAGRWYRFWNRGRREITNPLNVDFDGALYFWLLQVSHDFNFSDFRVANNLVLINIKFRHWAFDDIHIYLIDQNFP